MTAAREAPPPHLPVITLTLLGPVQVAVAGAAAPPELLWRKHVALLLYLARAPGSHTRDRLVGLLWPEKEDAKARHSLNEALRVLRRSLGDALVAEGDTLRVAPGTCVADVEDLSAQSLEALARPFLEGFALPDAPAFEDWVAAERERVRGLQLTVLAERGFRALDAGNGPAAIGAAEAALALDPHHEPAARLAMRAHALAGARGQALGVFDRLAERLQRDLAITPDAETARLAARIREGRVVVGGVPPGTEAAPTALVGPGPGVLAEMVRQWGAAVAGTPRVIVLTGEPGTGKSRLLDELAARARLDGAAVAGVRGRPGDDLRAVWSALFAGGLDGPEIAGCAPEVLAGLAAVSPDLLTRFPAARDRAGLPVPEAVREAAHAVAEGRPLLLLLDDAHRADPVVTDALAGIAARAGRRRVCVAFGAAPATAASDAVAGRIGRDIEGVALQTTAFGDADVAALVRDAFPAYRPVQVERLARRIMADTAGNPFLVNAVVGAVRSGLSLPEASRPWPAARRTLDDTLPDDLPASVAAALRVRFRALGAEAQQALAAVAVLGPGVDGDTVGRALGLPAAVRDAALDELEWTRWVVGDARGYAVATRLAREVVLKDMVTGGQQRRIRERAASPGSSSPAAAAGPDSPGPRTRDTSRS